MVARLIEGWESSTVLADYAGKWTSLSGVSIGTVSGRNGNGYRCNSNIHQASRTFDAQATWIVGFAFRCNALPTSICPILQLNDGAVVHCGLALQPSTGLLVAWRATTATVLGTSSAPVVTNAWNYIEAKFTISDTVGVVAVRINGGTVLNLTAQDTRNAGNASANNVQIGPQSSPGAGASQDFDDIYILDATGTVNNDFLGDCKVEQIVPTGAGATTAWTPSAGSNFQCVDDVPANGDTDYVSSATAAQTDTYQYGDLSIATTGSVKVVQATAQARSDDGGARSIALVARPGTTDRVGATQSIGAGYQMYPQLWDTNPDTAGAWTVAAVNGSQFGTRLIS